MIWKQFTHLEHFPPELETRFNSFLTTEFDDSLSVEMQFRTIIKWCQDNFKTVDTLVDFINDVSNWLKQFETDFGDKLGERVISVLSEWQESGYINVIVSEAIQWELDNYKELNDININNINNTLTTHEGYINNINNTLTTHEGYIDNINNTLTTHEGYIDNINNAITSLGEDIVALSERLIINVKDFGAVGDGVTDDTLAIQTAIDACVNKPWSTILFPPTDRSYLVSTLVIPENTHTLTLQGIGWSLIEFISEIGFTIFSEYIVIDNLALINKTARETGTTVNTRLFIDDRQYNRLDFDLKVTNCNIQYWQRVVQTWGRGVELKCNDFNAITEYVIRLEMRTRDYVTPGLDIQSYEEGYRGYDIINNRFHYCGGTIMASVFDNEKVLQGVNISNNRIEGTMAYFYGYCDGFISKNNQHYHNGNTTRTAFNFLGAKNVAIDVNIKNMGDSKMSTLVAITSDFENITIKGRVRGVNKNVIGISGNGTGISVDLNVSDLKKSDYTPNLVTVAGTANIVGLLVRGIVVSADNVSSGNTFIAVNNQGSGTVRRANFAGLVIVGNYSYVSNITEG